MHILSKIKNQTLQWQHRWYWTSEFFRLNIGHREFYVNCLTLEKSSFTQI